MYKKLSILLIALCILSGALYGCGNSGKKEKSQSTQANKEQSQTQVNKDKSQNTQPNNEQTKQDTPKVENETFIIYDGNIDTYKKEAKGEISIPKDKGIQEKLEAIAKKLSEVNFNNLPIEVLKIETVNGKKIAKINLKEDSKNQKQWFQSYMQGSAGGSITSVSLIETLLQKEYKGQWIDGIEFSYEGKKCEFEHAYDLTEIVYRK